MDSSPPRSRKLSLGQAARRLPVTSALLFVAGLLFSSTVYLQWFEPNTDPMFEKPGSIRTLVFKQAPEISGFFDLWRGEWWRITVSAFHHGSLWHLLGNAIAIWILADMLEPKLPRMRYLAFCLLAATFSMLPEIALGMGVIGLSGLAYAMFGLLLVLRRHDDDIAERFQGPIVLLGIGCLFLCIPLTMFGLLNVANGAHFFGLLYGYLFGWILYDVAPQRRLVATGFIFSIHALLVACVVQLTAPFWNGHYWAWRALRDKDPTFWARATERSPGLGIAWTARIELAGAAGDLHGAWKLALKAVRLNRADTGFDTTVRDLWRVFGGATERAQALDELKEVFGDESDAWLQRFKLTLPEKPRQTQVAELLLLPDLVPQPPVSLDRSFDVPDRVPGITHPHPGRGDPLEVDQFDPDSARLGETL